MQYVYDPASGARDGGNADTGFICWQAALCSGTAPVDAFGCLLPFTDGNGVSTVSACDPAA